MNKKRDILIAFYGATFGICLFGLIDVIKDITEDLRNGLINCNNIPISVITIVGFGCILVELHRTINSLKNWRIAKYFYTISGIVLACLGIALIAFTAIDYNNLNITITWIGIIGIALLLAYLCFLIVKYTC